MRLVDVHATLLNLGQPVFRTADAAAWLRIGNAHASKLLARLATAEHLIHLPRALWALPRKVDLLILPPYLTAPFPSYISLQSALFHHGMISQVPAVVYAVSPARTRRFSTPLGVVSIHHITPAFFGGFEIEGNAAVPIATPEKALIDLLYLGPAKSHLFRSWPELELPARFSRCRAREWIRHIPSSRRRIMVFRQFDQFTQRQNHTAVTRDRRT